MATPSHDNVADPPGWRHRIARAQSGARLGVALVASVVMAVTIPDGTRIQIRAVAAWNAFAVVALVLTWITILSLRPAQIQQLAQREDPSRLLSLIVVVTGACASLLAVVVLLQETTSMAVSEKPGAVMLALSAVALAWLLIHTVFTLRYAHQFYDGHSPTAALDFPGDEQQPDYLDFAYFAFVVGMTAQTADVNIRSRQMRRTVLLHGVVSFAFNTAVVTLSIGVLSSVLGGGQ